MEPAYRAQSLCLFTKLQDNHGFKRLVKDHIRPKIYGRQRSNVG